ncbi:hypothetical protein WICANDRAFT_29479 [Wickerhamomyces anomalus NRRL Y-366-8]|uniref:Vacuolar protein sorting-associated protein 29 n=1 Tax=Wickerhamomyces anomalus (strain ATCC 58044 / CBS 1984 / NCYC 433 / NRRL Y-366-8) TaxID=683960 RepID=A0A1E3P7A4_WICAA|nr:uncharacterized protein WICANDRAFT_29479 [Wickerhamomyces anomalus NRRL Y-366-8]ODQ61311.1 hypothetical protein WICANDRAFT_29479 [Wickerhamomyces anomalus NRRL Y-366-8]
MLVLAIGDLHIPNRAIDLPAKFKKLLVPGKISQVLCLGNATSSPSTLEFLKNLSPDFQIVKGEFDENTSLPLSLIITHGSLRIGFTNGFTIVPRGDPLSLLTSARQMNVDVLIWGGTHKVEAYTLEGKFFINPGSATDDTDDIYDSVPSFTLLDIQGSVITLYIYTYIGGEIKVDKVSYRKDQQ